MHKPTPLRQGDLVGVVAPAGAVDESDVAAGIRVLERAGFAVRVGSSVFEKHGYLAGTDAQRAADLHDMFRDPAVRAIVAARGGYGSGRLLPLIDVSLVKACPKIFVGHSDLTYLLNHLTEHAHLVTFHGPMVASFASHEDAVRNLLRALTRDQDLWQATAPEVVRPGTAEGLLVGGCLSIIVASLATPYAASTRGRLLFLEDVNEKAFRVDRMLIQLRQAGMLDEVAGVIFGEMPGCTAGDGQASARDVVRDMFADAPYPVAFGLPSGHGLGTVTLPLGIRARLAGDQLTLLEAPLLE
jgi:muramoyltetrapeptide carboxypeptidase